jgi:hypothetical protein
MQFSDTSTQKDGLIQDCEVKLFGDEGYGKISGNADRLAQMTNRIRRAQDRFTFLAMTSDGKWQWDDTNHVDSNGNYTYNIGYIDLTQGKRDYQFALEMLEVERVYIKTSTTGFYQQISPVDPDTERGKYGLYDELNTQGVPYRYDKRANAILLDPIPFQTIPLGMKVYFKRPAVYFTISDTVAQPGFASIFHNYLSTHAVQSYAADHSMPIAGGRLRNGAFTGLLLTVMNMEEDIKTFFGHRSGDENKKLEPRITSFN